MFASLATGNAVIVKPHPNAILPLAITVQIAREVLAEAGFDPNVVTLVAHDAGDDTAQTLALRPEVKLDRFHRQHAPTATGSKRNARQAQVYTEKAGVNQIIIDSADDFKGVGAQHRVLAGALHRPDVHGAAEHLRSRATASTPPKDTCRSTRSRTASRDGVQKLLGDPARAVEILGAVVNDGVAAAARGRALARRGRARQQTIAHPQFPEARDPHAADRQARCRRPREVSEGMVRPDRVRHRHRRHRRRASTIARDAVVRPWRADAVACTRRATDVIERRDRRRRRRRRRAVDQPDRRRVRQPVGGVLRFPRHRRQSGGQCRADRCGVRRQPLPRRAASQARLTAATGNELRQHPLRASPAASRA